MKTKRKQKDSVKIQRNSTKYFFKKNKRKHKTEQGIETEK